MVGHNWGSEHAATWIWLHGVAFDGAPGAWLDLSVGRVRIGPVLTPWIANGALHVDGRRNRLGGPRPAHVERDPGAAAASSSPRRGRRGPPRGGQTVAWPYADPRRRRAPLAQLLDRRAARRARRRPRARTRRHGGVYELGTTDTGHGIPVQPFSDG